MIRKNIILIGMPGCGKSTMGRRLARKLGMQFLDTDDVLRQYTGLQQLGEIQKKLGNAGYRKAEEEAVCSLQVQSTVIATGGSVPLSLRAMRHLKRNGVCVFLYVPCFQLQRRVGDLEQRGVLMGRAKTFEGVFSARIPVYRRHAQITFHPIRLSPGKSTELLAGLIRFLYDRPEWPRQKGSQKRKEDFKRQQRG